MSFIILSVYVTPRILEFVLDCGCIQKTWCPQRNRMQATCVLCPFLARRLCRYKACNADPARSLRRPCKKRRRALTSTSEHWDGLIPIGLPALTPKPAWKCISRMGGRNSTGGGFPGSAALAKEEWRPLEVELACGACHLDDFGVQMWHTPTTSELWQRSSYWPSVYHWNWPSNQIHRWDGIKYINIIYIYMYYIVI